MLACVCLRAAVRNYSPGRLDWLNPAHEKIFIVILISIAILILDRPNSQFPPLLSGHSDLVTREEGAPRRRADRC